MKYIKLFGALAIALAACSCSSSSVALKETSMADSKSSSRERQFANDLFNEVNKYRSSQGLEALKPHSGLNKLAKPHSEYMKKNAGKLTVDGKKSLVSHYGFDARAILARKKYQINSTSENVIASYEMGQGPDLAAKMVRGWLSSPDHRHNLLAKWDRTGIAVSYDDEGRVFVTQLFGSEPSQLVKVGGPSQW